MKNSLQKYIIQSLSKEKNKCIQTILEECPYSVSQSTLYRTISTMIKDNILVKKEQHVSLSYTRIMEQVLLVDTLKETYMENEIHTNNNDWETKEWTSTTLQWLLTIRWDLLVKYSTIYGENNNRYIYNSHPYLMLGMKETMQRIHSLTTTHASQINFLLWNKTVLDEYWAELIASTWANVSYTASWKFPSEWYFLNIIWDTIIQVILPKEISNYFEFIFTNTHDMSKFNISLFSNIFHMKSNYSLRVSINKDKAHQLRERIKSHGN